MSTSSAPIYLHYKLLLQSPAVVSTLSGDPSNGATQPFIPGGALRGAMAARLLAKRIDGSNEVFRRLILSGDVRYLHAYPELEGERSLPIPSSWRSRKDDRNSAYDLAAYGGIIDKDNYADPDDFDWPREALAKVNGLFSAASGPAGTVTTPRMGSRLHQQRDREKGRPWTKRNGTNEERRGVLFSCGYLEAEQVFRGAIQVMPAAAKETERIEELLTAEPILVGRSRRAGYGGKACIKITGHAQREYEILSSSVSRDVNKGAWFRALLVSAYVGRNPATGQIDPSVLLYELYQRLGNAATVKRTRCSFETVGAFNRTWRLEIPQALAVAAGAVLVLEATSDISAGVLRAIEHEGLGERRVDGFGRVLFLQHSEDHRPIQLTRTQNQASTEGRTSPEPASSSEEHPDQLELLEKRIILAAARAELDRVAVLDLVAQAERQCRQGQSQLPTNSLLERVRTLFRRATDEQEAQAALANLRLWCSDTETPQALKKNARNKLDRCKLGGDSLRLWLERLAEAEHGKPGWETLIQVSGNQTTLTSLAARNHLTSQAAAEAILHSHSALLRVHLVEVVLSAMVHLNRRGAR